MSPAPEVEKIETVIENYNRKFPTPDDLGKEVSRAFQQEPAHNLRESINAYTRAAQSGIISGEAAVRLPRAAGVILSF